MTIREQLEKEMEQEEIKELEENSIDDNKGYNEMDDFDSNINLDSDWSYPNQRALDIWRQCSISVFNGYVAVVCSS